MYLYLERRTASGEASRSYHLNRITLIAPPLRAIVLLSQARRLPEPCGVSLNADPRATPARYHCKKSSRSLCAIVRANGFATLRFTDRVRIKK
jgi:hypothetical protein